MDNLLEKVIEETTDNDLKEVALGISNLDLTPEEMEANLISSGHIVLNENHDNKV